MLFRSTELAEWRKTPLTRRSSLYGEGDFLPAFKLQLGLMLGSPEKIGQTFTNAVATGAGAGTAGSDWLIYEDRPTSLLDALGAKLRVSTAAVPYLPQLWVQGLYLGPLADGEPAIARAGSLIADPGTGNRIDLEAGALFQYGNIGIAPKFLWRTPVYQPLPSIPLASVSPRTYTDLFHVMHNREALRAEVVATWDPTGATWFHEWNNDDREEADFAASLGFTYDFYLGPTDSGSFVADSTGAVSVWPAGLPAISGTWALTGRLVARPAPTVRLVSTLVAGRGQSGGDPARDKPADYLGGTLRLMAGQLVADGELYLNAWGPEPWYREFHLTFPVQFKAGLSWAFGKPSFMDDTNRVGLALMYRGFDAMSPTDQSANGTIDGRYEIQTFVNLSL